MAEEDLGDWDEEFLEAAIKEEERHLTSSQFVASQLPSIKAPPPPLPPPFSAVLHHAPPRQQRDTSNGSRCLEYSPPRELLSSSIDFGKTSVHRFSTASLDLSSNSVAAARDVPSSTPRCPDKAKDLELENERLKRELGRVSTELGPKDKEIERMKKEVDRVSKLLSELEHEVHLGKRSDQKRLKATGVQADTSTQANISKKMLDIWGLSSHQNHGRNLISKLFMICSKDLEILFSHMNNNTPSHMLNASEASEAAKVSHLYSVMTKINSGMMDLNAFFEPLLDLCRTNHAPIIQSSLRMLNMFLKNAISLETNSAARNNVMLDEHESSESACLFHGSNARKPPSSNNNETVSAIHNPYQARFAADRSEGKPCSIGDADESLSRIDWVLLFELVHHIAMRRTEEPIRLEAVSIMTVIVMRSKAYGDREKFGTIEVLESISRLLNKDSGLKVRGEALRLLYLLLNCPKLLTRFNPYCKDRSCQSAATDDQEDVLASKAFDMILQGLAGCLLSCGNSSQDLELCKSVIKVLAFLASSGDFGFEILTSHKPSKDTNFLMLILQLLVSELDIEATLSTGYAETFQGRTTLMRESLILLNRLVSNHSSSAIVLRELTKNRDMASLTVDVATRLSRRTKFWQQSDSTARTMREEEIIDLGRGFKKRVFTYLGDNAS